MAKDVTLGHPGTAHAVDERRLDVGVGRVQLFDAACEECAPMRLAREKIETKRGRKRPRHTG
jgi:hypothetical protein